MSYGTLAALAFIAAMCSGESLRPLRYVRILLLTASLRSVAPSQACLVAKRIRSLFSFWVQNCLSLSFILARNTGSAHLALAFSLTIDIFRSPLHDSVTTYYI